MRRALLLGLFASGLLAARQGKDLFERRCSGCHALDRDKEGPRLSGIYGRKAGSVGLFPYSDALKNAGFVWDAEALLKWLADPDKLVPGNNMPFRVPDTAERSAIVEYLKQLR